MRIRRGIRRRAGIAAAAVVVGAGAVTAVGAGSAEADTHYPLRGCIGLSPNVVDVPYQPTTLSVAKVDDHTFIDTSYNSLWVFAPYESFARLEWRNLATNKRGSMTKKAYPAPWGVGGIHSFRIPTRDIDRGPVKVTLSALNRNALWSIPSQSCSGTVRVP